MAKTKVSVATNSELMWFSANPNDVMTSENSLICARLISVSGLL